MVGGRGRGLSGAVSPGYGIGWDGPSRVKSRVKSHAALQSRPPLPVPPHPHNDPARFSRLRRVSLINDHRRALAIHPLSVSLVPYTPPAHRLPPSRASTSSPFRPNPLPSTPGPSRSPTPSGHHGGGGRGWRGPARPMLMRNRGGKKARNAIPGLFGCGLEKPVLRMEPVAKTRGDGAKRGNKGWVVEDRDREAPRSGRLEPQAGRIELQEVVGRGRQTPFGPTSR